MAIYTGKIGYSVSDNPLTDSLYCVEHDIGFNIPPPETYFMITESGKFMQTEVNNNLMITEI